MNVNFGYPKTLEKSAEKLEHSRKLFWALEFRRLSRNNIYRQYISLFTFLS
jgi:hypothetical protein